MVNKIETKERKTNTKNPNRQKKLCLETVFDGVRSPNTHSKTAEWYNEIFYFILFFINI